MNLERLAARALFALPSSVHAKIGEPSRIDGLTLHPEIQAMLALRKRLGARPLSSMTPREARKKFRRECLLHEGPRLPVDAVRDFMIDGGLKLRHYRPRAAGARPLLVYAHGGGFVVGDLDTADIICRHLCRYAEVQVLSVDYRLAPEHPFPTPLEDVLRAFTWARGNATQLGADPLRVAIGGDSAGGHLSAVVTQELAREGQPQPAAQLLLYPATCRRKDWPSLDLFAQGFMLERREIDWFHFNYSMFLGPDDDIRLRPLDGLSEMRAPLAPAIIATAGFDPLRDEGEEYATRLRTLGGDATLRRFDALIHGFANVACVSRACRGALVEVAEDFKRIVTA